MRAFVKGVNMSSSSLSERASRKLQSDVIIAESDAMSQIWESRKKALKLTQKELAIRFEVKPATISAYLNGSIPLNLPFASFFAEQMGVTIDEFSPRLADEAGKITGRIDRESFRYPLLRMSQIPDFKEITEQFKQGRTNTNSESNNVIASYPSDVNAGDNGFWIKVDNDDMETYNGGIGFGKGVLVLIDPTSKPTIGDYAILKIKYNPNANLNLIESNTKYLLRLIKHDGENIRAWGLNPNANPITLTELNSELVGKVVSALYPPTMFVQDDQSN